jgi:hypothetical protein
MSEPRSLVNLARADYLDDSDDPTDIVERVKDAWRQVRTPRSRQNDFILFCGQQDGLTQSAIEELVAWEWQYEYLA